MRKTVCDMYNSYVLLYYYVPVYMYIEIYSYIYIYRCMHKRIYLRVIGYNVLIGNAYESCKK